MADNEIKVPIEIDTKALEASLNRIEKSIDQFSKSTEKSLSRSSQAFNSFIGNFAADIAVSAFTRLKESVKDFFVSSVDEAVKLENALSGIRSVATSFNQDLSATEKAVVNFTKDGLVDATTAALAFKQVLSTGTDLQTATKLLNSLKDSAAFNRQSFYSLGEAIVATTEGIKNGNSVKADAVGITKNLSVLEKEYAASIGKTIGQLTDQEKIQARVNGFIREGAIFTGDADKLTEQFSGQVAKLKVNLSLLQVELGKSVTKSVALAESLKLASKTFETLTTSFAGGESLVDSFVKGSLRIADVLYRVANIIVEGFGLMFVSIKGGFLGVFSLIEQGLNALGGNFSSFTKAFKDNSIDFKKSTDNILTSFTQSNVFSTTIDKINKKLQDQTKVQDDSAKKIAIAEANKFKSTSDQLSMEKERNKEAKQYTKTLNQQLELFKKIAGEISVGASSPFQALMGITETQRGLQKELQRKDLSKDERRTIEVALSDANKNAKFGAFAGLGQNLLQGAQGASKLLSSGVGAIADTFLPGLSAVAGPIAETLFAGPEAVKALVKSFAEAVPSLIENLINAIPALIEAISEQLPILIDKLVQSVPRIIDSLAQSMPQVAVSLAAQMPTVANQFAISMVENAPKIAEAIAKAIPQAAGGGVKSVGKLFKFADGGIVGGNSFSGDNVLARVNSGEMILNREQQATLFNKVNKPDNSSVIVDAINTLSMQVLNQPIIVQVDGREIARATRNQIKGGFVLA